MINFSHLSYKPEFFVRSKLQIFLEWSTWASFWKMSGDNGWRPRFSGLVVSRIHPRAPDELVYDVLKRKVIF